MRIIDTHCHIYPDKIAEKAAKATSDFYRIPGTHNGSTSVLIERGRAAGIDHFVINSVATTPAQVHAISVFIAAKVEEGKGIFTGLGSFHPDSDDIERDVDEIISAGLKGIKIHPDIQRFAVDDPRAMKLYEIIEGRLPILVHTGDNRYDYSNPDRVKRVLEAFPKLRMIGAHLGGWSIWESAGYELAKYENFTVDCSSSLYAITPGTAVDMIRLYGVDRVMFGTDYPLWDPVEEVERFNKLDLSEEEREKILYKNAEKFYNIKL